jgi:hypothetical protein
MYGTYTKEKIYETYIRCTEKQRRSLYVEQFFVQPSRPATHRQNNRCSLETGLSRLVQTILRIGWAVRGWFLVAQVRWEMVGGGVASFQLEKLRGEGLDQSKQRQQTENAFLRYVC